MNKVTVTPDSNVKRFFILSGPTVHRALFSGAPASLYPELRNWPSVQPFTTATDTVWPLTFSLFCPSRATSPHGIINQPEARRLAWPLWPLALQDFPQPYVCGSPWPTPPLDRGKLNSQEQQRKLVTTKEPSKMFYNMGSGSDRHPYTKASYVKCYCC